MKRKVFFLTTALLISVGVVSVLYLSSMHYNLTYGSFARLFPPHPIIHSNTIKLKYNSYYIAGLTENSLYLGNLVAPSYVFASDYGLKDTAHFKISIENRKNNYSRSVKLTVDSPFFYLMDGVIPSIYKGVTSDWEAKQVPCQSFFTQSVPISNSSFAIKAVSNKSHENVLGKQMPGVEKITLANNILEKQIDGLFCTDGVLHYDKHLSELIYVYFYRNQFIRIDTNLSVTYRARTIDTVSQAKISVAKISSEKSITLSSPPLWVNKRSCVSNGLLFIQSNSMSKNEIRKTFEKASVIDTYNLKDSKYKFSFYVFDNGGEKLRDFKVHNNTLVLLFETYLSVYKLSPQYLF